jgi:hypothetical protein
MYCRRACSPSVDQMGQWITILAVQVCPLPLCRGVAQPAEETGRVFFLFALVASGLVVTFLFIFILNWSEFLLALTLIQPAVSTLPVRLNKFQSAVQDHLYGPQDPCGGRTVAPQQAPLLALPAS